MKGLRLRRASKALERAGRRLLTRCVARWFAVAPRAVTALVAPRVLVIRLDERLGNLVMLTPLVRAVAQRFEGAAIDVLVQARGAALLASHPAVRRTLTYRKWHLWAADGPLRRLLGLRRARYDVCIDAGNPTDPSFTQALLCRCSGARHTVGPATGAFAPLYSAPVAIDSLGRHEIDMRLQLLAPLGVDAPQPTPLPHLNAPSIEGNTWTAHFMHTHARYVVVNVGARLRDRVLDVDAYRALVHRAPITAVVTFGPHPRERRLAEAVCAHCPQARLAAPTGVKHLGALMGGACAVLSADTGPMHLAVAMGAPTCGLFVHTDPVRYGYGQAPHAWVQVGRDGWLTLVAAWMQERCSASLIPC